MGIPPVDGKVVVTPVDHGRVPAHFASQPQPVGVAPNPADAEAILARARGITDGRVLRHTAVEV